MSALPGKFALFALIAAAFLAGCQAKIGDKCQTVADCTTGIDGICDVTLPGGYCTIFNCEPNTCPTESACVAFRTAPAAAAACRDSQQSPRLERTFCMRHCNSDADCRPGYTCVGFSDNDPVHNPWSAEVIDSVSAAVCVVPYSGPAPSDPRQTDVCSAAPMAPVTPSSAGSDAAAASDATAPSALNVGDSGDGG